MQKEPITVAIVDDHPIVRAGIRAVLATAPDLSLVAEGASGADALRLAEEHRPDVLVLDVNLPDINGLEVTRRLRHRGNLTPIVILTVHNDSQKVLGLLEAGASGYVLKDEALDRLAAAVRAAARGETWLSPAVAGQVVRRAVAKSPDQGQPASDSPLSPLTPRPDPGAGGHEHAARHAPARDPSGGDGGGRAHRRGAARRARRDVGCGPASCHIA